MGHRTSKRARPSIRTSIAWLTAAALAAGVACGGDDDSPPATPGTAPSESAAPAETPPAATEVPAPSDARGAADPDLEVTQGELPSGFPSDLPTYPGATPGTSVAVPGGGMLVTFDSDDSADTIGEFFRRELEGQGWEVTDLAAGDFRATKAGRNARITVTEVAGAPTRIAVGTTAE